MSAQPIPNAALDDRLGFTGMTGSGKTFGAGTCVERILAKSGRVIIPDPLGVWYGLRLLADGKTPSPYDIVIFGGPHGDLPLTPNAGALIGETVAQMRESAILDLSQFETAAAERRFMLAFLDALYRKATGEPVHLIFDEADMWAPERIMDKTGDATKLHGVMQTVVRRGRIKGLTSWLITQRPASLSKNVLSQVEGLVAFKLTASQDRKALGLWIEGQADKEQGKAILARLPEKRMGEAVVWLPHRGILGDVTFPLKQTYDSSRAPKRGEKLRTVALKPLDLDALKDRLSTVEAETKANDPRLLRVDLATANKRIAELERQMAAGVKQNIMPNPKALEDAKAAAFEEGERTGRLRAVKAIAKIAEDMAKSVGRAETACADTRSLLDSFASFISTQADAMQPAPILKRAMAPLVAASAERRLAAQAPKPEAARTPMYNNVHSGDGELTGPQRRVIASLSFWQSIGHSSPSREQLAAVAGYSPNSGNFQNVLGGMRQAGMIDYPGPGLVCLSHAAVATAMSMDEAKAMLLSVLNTPQKRVVDAAAFVEDAATREDIAERAGYSHNSGNFQNIIGSLNTLGIFTKAGAGRVALSGWARELLAS